ncbi:protein WVD2-like 7 isoform X2 [Rhodamnia argentea]|uniref:Protein WVD2-like 7 isoform X2 n=1 Tax=Rhodamnia argentea TaxID=178133 RepID=A0A8B8R596_9MYRT|nr:protein WVD2-like 7 isoform X2 [Rhodamnia argentea]
MAESLASNAALEVSVSFGRFENDSLSWEKWSSFSPNKYLEEVEKCATPGSVAQKKAYFEAHYKKIAARKAELLNQEKQMENGSSGSDDPKCKDPGSEIDEPVFEIGGSKDENLGPVIEQVKDSVGDVGQRSLEQQIHDAVAAVEEDQILPVEGVTEEPDSSRSVHGLSLEKLEDDEFVKEVVQEVPIGSSEAKQLQQNLKNDTVKTEKVLQENVKLNRIRKPQKINPVNKERNTAKTKGMTGSPVVKSSSKASALRLSKPTSASAAKSAAKPSAKKETVPTLPRKKNPLNVEIKKVPSKSLNVSISSDFTNFNRSDISTSRKSLIMEKMGDKDIVKRAFKTFQGSLALSKSFCGERSSVPKPAPSLVTEARDPNSATEQKGKEGQTKAGSVGKKVPKILPSSFGLRSDGRAEKRKEFRKNLEEKSTFKEVEKAPLQSKPKEKRDEEMKKLRQSLNFKATPLPAFYLGQTKSKSCLAKEGYKSETRGREKLIWEGRQALHEQMIG